MANEISIKLFHRFTFVAVLIGSVACGRGGITGVGELTLEAPPIDVLQSNFDQASHVFEIEVEDVRQVATFLSDSGEVGYVQYSVTGTVLDVLKSGEEWDAVSGEVEYRFTQEYDPGEAARVIKGSRFLVFLKLADEPPRFWVIGNGAQFRLSPELSKSVRQFTEKE